MAEAVSERSGILEKINRNIALVGSAIAALVGINTALTTCSAQTAARHQTLRQAVDGEELYWRNLYSDYLAVFDQEVDDSERQARLFALSVLTDRQVPHFEEYSMGLLDGGDARLLATRRLETMKRQLKEALARPATSDPQVAAAQQVQTFASAVRAIRDPNDRAADESGNQGTTDQTTGGAGVNYLPQTLANGDAKGWDLDVFWCGGGGAPIENRNFDNGLRVARALSKRSARGELLGDQKLGRIRLLMLPEVRQGGVYPTRGSGFEIRPEKVESEQRIAAAVRSVVPSGASFRVVASDQGSAWHLSLFVCAAGSAAAGRPQPASGKVRAQ